MHRNKIIAWGMVFGFLLLAPVMLNAQLTVTNDTVYCGDSVTLTANSTIFTRNSYAVSQIAYSPEVIGGGFINFMAGQVVGPLPIGFDFCYFGTTYTNCYITNSGFISFTAPTLTAYTPTPLPFAGAAIPNNSIFPAWQDWNAGLCGIPPCVQFQTLGVAPNRRYVVTWNTVLMSNATCPGMTGTFQIVLFETSDIIETHIISKPSCPAFPEATQGIQNQTGTVAVTAPGRNAQVWAATNESWRFEPNGVDWFVVGGGQIGTGDTIKVAPGTPTSYYATVSDCNGNTFSDTVEVDFQLPQAFIDAGPDQVICEDSTFMNAINPTPRTGRWTIISGQPVNIVDDTLPNTAITNILTGQHVFEWTVFDGCDTIRDTMMVDRFASFFLVLDSLSNVPCAGDSSGSINLDVFGANTPLAYSWSNGSTTEDISNLPAGSYNLTISDSLGCFIDTSYTIAQLPALNLMSFAFDAGCFGDSAGFIVVNASGGAGPYFYSIDSMNFQTSDTLGNLMGGSYHIVVVDSNGCVARDTSVLLQYPAIVPSLVSIVHPSCPLDSNGSITISATGGLPPYQYTIDGINFQSVTTFDSLPPGPDTVTIVDAAGCFGILPFLLVAPNALQGSIAMQSNVNCFGLTNGSVTVSTIGGSPPYSFSINGINFFNDSTFSNLGQGNYVVTIMDSSACTDTVNVNISEPALLQLSSFSIDVVCPGNSDGSIFLTATGGTPPYVYINGTDTNITPVFDSLSAGIYDSLEVIDSNGCIANISDTINTPPGLMIDSIQVIGVSCFGGNDGVITIFASGGSGQFDYSTDAIFYYPSPSCIGLPPGPTIIYVRDTTGCIVSTDTIIPQPDSISLSIDSFINPSCPFDSNGSIIVTATGGTGPFTYSLDGINFQTDSLFVSLGTGSDTVIVMDANGCLNGLPFVLTAADAIAPFVFTQTNASCFGLADGSVTISAAGGMAPYTFSIDNITFLPDSTFNGLGVGNYIFTVRDFLNCEDTVSATISEPTALFINTSSINVSCFGLADGSISITANGGTPPYSYIIGLDTQLINLFSPLPAGIYDSITVIDANGCVIYGIDSILEPVPVLVDSAVATDVQCNGDLDGFVEIFASGGIPPFQYSLDGITFQNPNIIMGLAAGSYVAFVSDSNSCTDSTSFVVSEPPLISFSVPDSLIVNVSCNGLNDGSAVIIVDSGGIAPFRYSIDGGLTYQTSNTFLNLPAGTYNNVVVMDADSCTSTSSFVIAQPPPINISNQIQDISCFGDDNGQIIITANGGTTPYLYSIDAGVTFSGSNTFINLPPGTYDIAVQDDSSCVGFSTVVITEPDVFMISALTETVSCFGYNDGAVTIQTSGGVPPYDAFAISDDGINFTSTNVNFFNNLIAGFYTVVADDGNNCPASVDFTIDEPDLDTFTYVIDSTSCFGSQFSNGAISIFDASVNAPYLFSIDGSAFTTDSVFGGLTAGLHTLIWENSNGCKDTVELWVPEPDPIIVFVDPDTLVITLAESGQVFTTFSGADNISYDWLPSTGLSCADCPNPVVQAYGPSPVEYTVYVQDLNNPSEEPRCFGSGSFLLIVDHEQRYFMPNAFTPNNDGENDILYVYGENVEYIDLQVFDRWGNKVFVSERLQDGWDGIYQGKMMDPGVYTFTLLVHFLNNEQAHQQGSVTLIR